jgi:hypothetical protein
MKLAEPSLMFPYVGGGGYRDAQIEALEQGPYFCASEGDT